VELRRATVPHTKAGLSQLVGMLDRAGVREIGIERGDGPMVDALLEAGFVVFVIAPNQVRNLRRRLRRGREQGRPLRRLRAG